jgi:hypothetical protein
MIDRVRTAFVHRLVVDPAADFDDRAPGGAVTRKLCGTWDHEGPVGAGAEVGPDGRTSRWELVEQGPDDVTAAEMEMADSWVTSWSATGNYPSKGRGERGAWFRDNSPDAQPVDWNTTK